MEKCKKETSKYIITSKKQKHLELLTVAIENLQDNRDKNKVKAECTEAIKKEAVRWKKCKQKDNVKERTLKSLREKAKEKIKSQEKQTKGTSWGNIQKDNNCTKKEFEKIKKTCTERRRRDKIKNKEKGIKRSFTKNKICRQHISEDPANTNYLAVSAQAFTFEKEEETKKQE